MSKIYAIGDLHLSLNPNIDKPQDVFGSEWENYVEKLKNNWETTVKDDDIVILAGDLSWALLPEEAVYDLRFIASLPGKKVIFKGNHDLWWPTQRKVKNIFEDENMFFIKNNSFETIIEDKKVVIAGTRGWVCPGDKDFTEHDRKMYERESIRLKMSLDDAKKKNPDILIGVLHYPPTNDKKQSSNFTEILSEYGVTKCVYGHIHGKGIKSAFNGWCDGIEFKLVSADALSFNPFMVIEQ